MVFRGHQTKTTGLIMKIDAKSTIVVVARMLATDIINYNRKFRSLPKEEVVKTGISTYVPLIKMLPVVDNLIVKNRSKLIENSYDDYIFVHGVCSKFKKLTKESAYDSEFLQMLFDLEQLSLYYLKTLG